MQTALTPRMQEALDIVESRKDERGGKGPTLQQIGEAMGLSRERVRQLIAIGQRRLRFDRQWVQRDAHVTLWRQLMTDALQAIRRAAARQQRAARREGDKPLPAIYRATKAARDLVASLPLSGPFNTLPRFKRHGPPEPPMDDRHMSQERLHRLASKAFYGDIVWRNGTDHIVSIRRFYDNRWWRGW